MPKKISVNNMIEVVVALVIGVVFLSLVISSVASAALSLTGAAQTIVNTIPTIYVVGLLLYVIHWATSGD